MESIGNGNFEVRIIPLPIEIEGVTVPSADDEFYNVFINSNHSIETQNKALKHELRHVLNLDFDGFEDIEIIEKRANGSKNVE